MSWILVSRLPSRLLLFRRSPPARIFPRSNVAGTRTILESKQVAFRSFSLWKDKNQDNRTENPLIKHVGIFWDLDNVHPETYGRPEVKAFASPLLRFSAQISGREKPDAALVFGNLSTQTWVTAEEKEMVFDQEYQQWDGEVAATGHDEEGQLRCGICGRVMRLTKKNIKAGMTLEKKLRKHMKELHDREQKKRIERYMGNSKKGKKGMPEKERAKYDKYISAQVGLGRLGLKPAVGGKTNDLFRVMKELGFRCYSVDNVDETLTRRAKKWLRSKISLAEAGCIIVVSSDSDFVPLLRDAHAQDYLVVTASLDRQEQTTKVREESDIVIRMKAPYTADEEMPSYGPFVLDACTSRGKTLISSITVNYEPGSDQGRPARCDLTEGIGDPEDLPGVGRQEPAEGVTVRKQSSTNRPTGHRNGKKEKLATSALKQIRGKTLPKKLQSLMKAKIKGSFRSAT